MVKWNTAVDHVSLFNRIRDVMESGGRNDAGVLFDYQSCIAIFVDSFEFDEDIRNEFMIDDKEVLIQAAVADVRKTGKFTKERLENAIKKRLREFIRTEKTKYSVVTTLNVSNDNLEDVTYRGTSIKFSRTLSPGYRKARSELMSSRRIVVENYDDSDKLFARAVVKARGPSAAMKIALSRIDMLRGLWDISQVPLMQMSSPYNKTPIHTVEKGPVHSVHMPGGEIAIDTYWFELYSNIHDRPVLLKDRTLQYQIDALNQLRNIRFNTSIEETLERAAIALSNSNFEYVFLQLWATLEKLCCSSRADGKTTVKRASYIFIDRQEKSAILNHLRLLRNSLAHYRAGDRDLRIPVFQLYYFVRTLIKFNLDQSGGFDSLESVCRALDLPDDQDSLEENLRVNETAMYWRRYRRRKSSKGL